MIYHKTCTILLVQKATVVNQMKSSKERQALRREKAASEGKKSLSLGMMHESFHRPFKELAKKAKDGLIEPENIQAQFVRDHAAEDKLKDQLKELTLKKRDIESAYKSLKAELARRDRTVSDLSQKLGILKSETKSYKNILWRLWWR